MREQDETILVNFNREEELMKLLEQTYTDLGKAYYEGGFEDPLPELLPIFDRITSLKKELETEKKEKKIKQQNAGPQPGVCTESEPAPGPAEHSDRQPVPQPAPAPEMLRAAQPGPVQHNFCIYCGSPLQPGDLFCSNCGNKIG